MIVESFAMFTPEAVRRAPETVLGVALVPLEAVLHAAISAVSKAISRKTSMGLHARKGTGVTEHAVRFERYLIIFSLCWLR